MKKIALILCLFSSASYASELSFGFKNPSFSGVGYSSHVLTIDNLEQTRKQKIIEDKKTEAAKAKAHNIKNAYFTMLNSRMALLLA